MAQRVELNPESFKCSVCVAALKEPVTIPCGHSYCKSCINGFWDGKDTFSCPACLVTFRHRPLLVRNIMISDLLQEMKDSELHAHTLLAGPEDVACDVCVEKKLKAVKSCLVCLASFCEEHLEPHYCAAPLRRHKLVEPSKNLQGNFCPRHGEVMKLFCRTDRQCVCLSCFTEEHRGHEIVSVAEETAERLRELKLAQRNLQRQIKNREKDLDLLQQVRVINVSGGPVERESRTKAIRVKYVQKKLQQEISELRRREEKLRQLSVCEDQVHFLKTYTSLPKLGGSSSSSVQLGRHSRDLKTAASGVKGKTRCCSTPALQSGGALPSLYNCCVMLNRL